MKLFDVVRLKVDLPEECLHKGIVGTVVELFDTPEVAYEVEFVNDRGETICEVLLKSSQLELCQPVAHGPRP